jgi:hypothetical protein
MPGARVDYRWSKRLPLMVFTRGRGAATADARGVATFRVPPFDSLDVYGDRNLRPTHDLSIFNHRWESELQVLHTKDGASDRSSRSAAAPKARELNVSIEFSAPGDPDPPATR